MTLPNVTRESNSTRARAEHSIPYGTENIVRSSSFVYIGGSFSAKIAGFSGLASGSHYFNIESYGGVGFTRACGEFDRTIDNQPVD